MLEYSPSVFSRTTTKSMSPGLAVGQRAPHAGHQPARPQVDVLVEAAAELEQAAPQRHVVGHDLGPADGAEEDRVEAAEQLEPVRRAASRRARRSSRRRRSRTYSNSSSRPNASAAASRTRSPSGTTSLPMPSPGMTAMRCGSVIRRPVGSGKWQATTWPPPAPRAAASTVAQMSWRLPAARAEAAAGRRVDRARHVAGQHDALAAPLDPRVGHGHRREQRLRVGVRGRVVDCVDRALLDDRPRYITATRSLTWRTTDRSWAMNR